MQIIFGELARSLKKGRNLAIILVLQFSLGFFLLLALLKIYLGMTGTHTQFVAMYNEKQYYKLVDRLTGETEEYFNRQADSLSRLKALHRDFIMEKNFTYLEISSQPIEIIQKDIKDEKFMYMYEAGRGRPGVTIEGQQYTSSKCITANLEAQREFRLRTIAGRLFQEEDIIYQKGQPVPVLLGYEYKDHAQIGDVWSAQYLSQPMELRVVGILEPDLSMRVQSNPCYLDRYIIIPSFDFLAEPANQREKFFQKASYLNKVNGTAITYTNGGEVVALLQKLCDTYDIPRFSVIGAGSAAAIVFQHVSAESLKLMLFLGLIIFAFSVAGLSVTLLGKVMSNLKVYAVHLLCGGSMNTIRIFVLLETGTIVGISFMIAAGAFLALTGQRLESVIWGTGGALGVITAVIAAIPTLLRLTNQSMSQLSKREE